MIKHINFILFNNCKSFMGFRWKWSFLNAEKERKEKMENKERKKWASHFICSYHYIKVVRLSALNVFIFSPKRIKLNCEYSLQANCVYDKYDIKSQHFYRSNKKKNQLVHLYNEKTMVVSLFFSHLFHQFERL